MEQEKLLSYKGRKSGRPLSKSKNEVLNKILKTNSVTADKINSNFFFNRSYYPLSLEIGSGSAIILEQDILTARWTGRTHGQTLYFSTKIPI